MSLPQRKSNRLPHYDYSQFGTYFLTVCAKNKEPLFCRIEQGTVFDPAIMKLTPYGEIVQQQILNFQKYYSDIRIDHYVIMLNHIHFLVSILTINHSLTNSANSRIPALVSTLKRFTNKTAGRDLWHRSYYDHVIRDDQDYQIKWKYIDDNPIKWVDDEFYAPIL